MEMFAGASSGDHFVATLPLLESPRSTGANATLSMSAGGRNPRRRPQLSPAVSFRATSPILTSVKTNVECDMYPGPTSQSQRVGPYRVRLELLFIFKFQKMF
jgi:hypothetical protein